MNLRINKYEVTDCGEREIEARLDWELSYISDEIKAELNGVAPQMQTG